MGKYILPADPFVLVTQVSVAVCCMGLCLVAIVSTHSGVQLLILIGCSTRGVDTSVTFFGVDQLWGISM